MLSTALDQLIDEQAGTLSPERLAAKLHMPMSELAQLLGIHRNTLKRRPEAPGVQSKVGLVARIIAAAAELLRSEAKAVVWFRYQPLAGFDGRTAAELVADGHSDAVITHLEMLRDGAYA